MEGLTDSQKSEHIKQILDTSSFDKEINTFTTEISQLFTDGTSKTAKQQKMRSYMNEMKDEVMIHS
jgi:hypothetical protein